MGQYWKIVNLSKREVMVTQDGYHSTGFLGKLMEFSYTNTKESCGLMKALAGPWKGDEVILVGDYFDKTSYEPSEPEWTLVDRLEAQMGNADRKDENGYPVNLYSLSDVDEWKTLDMRGDDVTKDAPTLLVNDATRQYVDLDHAPASDIWVFGPDQRHNGTVVYAYCDSPATLLLACGNDLGGGDFHAGCHGYKLVGSWAARPNHVWAAYDKSEIPADYTEFCPDFYEGGNPVAWDEIENAKAAKLAEYEAAH